MTVAKDRATEVVQDGPHRGLVLRLASSGKARYMGTIQLPSGKWRAYFNDEKSTRHYCGTFDKELDAAIAAARRSKQGAAAVVHCAATPSTAAEPKGMRPPATHQPCTLHRVTHHSRLLSRLQFVASGLEAQTRRRGRAGCLRTAQASDRPSTSML